jgi:succinoglycan biosynthesis transport protein ExoP
VVHRLAGPRETRDGGRALTLRQLLQALWRRKLLIVVTALVAVVAAFGYAKLRPAHYVATATVQLEQSSGTSSGSGVDAAIAPPNPSELATSVAVADQAASYLHESDPSALLSGVTASVDGTTNALLISDSASSPTTAADVANAFARGYVAVAAQDAKLTSNALSAELAQIQARLSKLYAEQAAHGGTDAAVSVAINAALSVYSSVSEAQVAASIQGAGAFLSRLATPPAAPSGPGTKKIAGLGLAVGVLAGCGIALIREQYDPRVRSRQEVERVASLPVLAELPNDREQRRHPSSVVALDRPRSALAEAVRELRTSVQVAFEGKPCPIVVVSSPEPSEGKTFVVANLAASFALAGRTTVVVSADLRRPRLEAALGLASTSGGLGSLLGFPVAAPASGTTAVTAGEPASLGDRLRQVLLATPVPSLWILPAGSATRSPGELLASPLLSDVFEELRQMADVVVVDSPPVLVAADTTVLAGVADGLLLVTAEGSTDRNALAMTVERLRATRIQLLGAVLNRARHAPAALYEPYYGVEPRAAEAD